MKFVSRPAGSKVPPQITVILGRPFAIAFALPGIAWRFLGLNAVVTFWTAYVLTRPLGASFADWTGKSRAAGGLGIGDGIVALLLFIAIAALVRYLTVRDDRVGDLSVSDPQAEAAG